MLNLGTPYTRHDPDNKYWDADGFRVMRPVGTKYVTGLVAWCEAIPEHQRGILIEIGTYLAESTIIHAHYFRRVITIDPLTNEPGLYAEMMRRIEPYPNIEHIRGFSTEVIPTLGPADAFYIDGNHRPGAVNMDILCCEAHGGNYIGGHDYIEGGGLAEVVHRHFSEVQTFKDMSWLAIV